MLFSYFPYTASFVVIEGQVDPNLFWLGVALAPFPLVVFGFVSRNPRAARSVLRAMGILILVSLTVGIVTPALGAAAGFGVGAALTLNPPVPERYLRPRLVGVGLAVIYTFVLLVIATPAGVLSGAVIPVLMVGFADEFSAWRNQPPSDT